MKLLSPDEIDAVLREHPLWNLAAGELVRLYAFETFPQAIAFVGRIALLAEQANHHPDIDIRYNRVRLALVSHNAGGLTRRDAAMVASIEESLHEAKIR